MKNLKEFINEGALKSIIQFTRLQGDVTKKYLELAKEDDGRALQETEKYARSIFGKYVTTQGTISFDEWWKTFEKSLGVLFEESKIDEAFNVDVVRKAVGDITEVDKIYFDYIIGGFSKKPKDSKKDYDDFSACIATRSAGRKCPCSWVYWLMLGDEKYCDGIPEPLGNEDDIDVEEMWNLIHSKDFKIVK